jgi:pyridoxamine 5'-phosphate oxidase
MGRPRGRPISDGHPIDKPAQAMISKKQEVREMLRDLSIFAAPMPTFDVEAAPDNPLMLFIEWLIAAVGAGVVEPHAMTLSTVDTNGSPSARTLILKDVDGDGMYFASSCVSPKGHELAARPSAALTFYWRELGRQVRVKGDVTRADPERSLADFRARPRGSQIEALIGRQSQILESRDELEEAIETMRRRLEEDPNLLASDWTLFKLLPFEVEFWQADRERRHIRLRYRRTDNTWLRHMLWP